MAQFTVTITDTSALAGITAARAVYNAPLGETDQERQAHDDYIATDADYVQFVMLRAADSYASQYGT